MARKYGLAIDNLLSARVVTAEGEIVTASASEHPDLFWAIRGGGGNFGIVTRFQYRLHPVDTVIGGALFLPATRATLRGLVDAAKAAPDELTMIAFVMQAPPLPMIPAEAHGQLVLMILPVYAGDLEEGQKAMAPFRALAEPVADLVGPMPYVGMYQLLADAAAPAADVTRSLFAHDLDDAAIGTILERMARPSGMTLTQLRVFGGAMARVPNDATAFAHRDKDVQVTIINIYEGDRALHEAWTDEYFRALAPIADGVYSNFLQNEGEARIRDAYPEGTFERLVNVKRRYDPTNLFHLNQNIRP
jgi:FAD/FMN-containing dehydrogenase